MKLFVLLFLKTLAFIDYDTCVRNGDKYLTLDDWMESFGIDFTKTKKVPMERLGALNLHAFSNEKGKSCYLFNLKTDFDFLNKYLAKRVVRNYLDKAKVIIPEFSLSYNFSCYLRGKRAYFFFEARGLTQKVNMGNLSKQSFSYRLVFYSKVLNYLREKIRAGIVFSHFMLSDFFLINNDIDKMMLVALNEMMYQNGDYSDDFLKVFYNSDEHEADYYKISEVFLDRRKFSKEEFVYINLLYNIEFIEKQLCKPQEALRKDDKKVSEIRAKFLKLLNKLLYYNNRNITFERLDHFLNQFSEELKAEIDSAFQREQESKIEVSRGKEFDSNKFILTHQEAAITAQITKQAETLINKSDGAPNIYIKGFTNQIPNILTSNIDTTNKTNMNNVVKAKRIKPSRFRYLSFLKKLLPKSYN